MADVEIGEFIAARLGEEEALARAVLARPEGRWFAVPDLKAYDRETIDLLVEAADEEHARLSSRRWILAGGDGSPDPERLPWLLYVVSQEPANTLARVAALRALVDELGFWTTGHEEIVYRSLAAIWSWHPDYDESWKP